MDVKRTDLKAKKRRKRMISAAIVIVGIVAVFIFFARLGPAAPSVDRDSVWVDEVREGPLVVKVRGIGSLVPVDIRWLTAQTSARVETIEILPGAQVEPATIILQLDNPELKQTLRNAELELASAQAQLANQRVQEEDGLLEMEYQLAQLLSNFESAKLDVRVNEELFAEGLVAERDLLRSQLMEDQLGRQTEILERRLETRRQQVEQNLAPAIANVSQEQDRVKLLRQQVEELKLRAGMRGILQRLPVEVGQNITAGAQLAQVADPSHLKATVRIPETQAKDIAIGLPADIDTRNGVVEGKVSRVNPTVEGGTVDVDVELLGELPRGARADLTVEGSIILENLQNVVFVGRPSFARENATVGIFKMTGPDSSLAERTQVRFGRTSVSEIQIVEGLVPGDRVILSDTSQYDDSSHLRLN